MTSTLLAQKQELPALLLTANNECLHTICQCRCQRAHLRSRPLACLMRSRKASSLLLGSSSSATSGYTHRHSIRMGSHAHSPACSSDICKHWLEEAQVLLYEVQEGLVFASGILIVCHQWLHTYRHSVRMTLHAPSPACSSDICKHWLEEAHWPA